MPLDMGTHFDYMSERSNLLSESINLNEKSNHLFLKKVMEEYRVKPYEKEWWHFTPKNEPFPETYFDFPID